MSLFKTIQNAISSFEGPAVDIEQSLDRLSARGHQGLHWRTSIVDLMKVVGVDPSYQNRKALAAELGYQGDPADSVTMSIWLHKELMKRLSKDGAGVPASLRH